MPLPEVKDYLSGPHGAINVFWETSGTATDLYTNGTELTSANPDRKATFERYWWLHSEISWLGAQNTPGPCTYPLRWELLLGFIKHVRGGTGLFCKNIFAFQRRNRNVRLVQCKLVTRSRLLLLLSWRVENSDVLVIMVCMGRTVPEYSLYSWSNANWSIHILQNHKHTQSFIDTRQVSEKNFLPAAQSKYWGLADVSSYH